MSVKSDLGINQYCGGLMCLAQRHNTVPPVVFSANLIN